MATVEPATYTASEACTLLKVERHTLLKHLREGRWGAFKMGRDWRIPKRLLDLTLSGAESPAKKGR